VIWRLYVSVGIATALIAVPVMWKALRNTWRRRCPCCGDPVEAWRRFAACSVIAGIFVVRAVVWFVWIPGEIIWALHRELRAR
jgi:hypothetical protein